MGHILKIQAYRDALLGSLLIVAVLSLMIWPECSSAAASDGLSLCCNVIVPSLFPFFVLSSLVIKLGLSRYLGQLLEGVMGPLFRVNGNCATALALGFIGGYPVGATTAISLYQNGQCSKTEAERLLAFCNNAGPAFIFGVVGAGIFSSSYVGLLLYLGHILASLTVGILFRFYKPHESASTQHPTATFELISFPTAFVRSVTDALQATLNICAFVLFFTVIIRMCTECGLIAMLSTLLSHCGIPALWTERLFVGLFELSSGVSSLRGSPAGNASISLSAFMLGWAGLSVHCQVLAFLGDCNLSMRTYFIGKLLHGIISAAMTSILILIFPLPVPASSYLCNDIQALASQSFYRTLAVSTAIVWLIWICFFLLAINNRKKRVEKRQKRVYTEVNKS